MRNDSCFEHKPKGAHSALSVQMLAKKVSKGAKISNRYNQVPHPTQDTNGKVTHSQLDTTNESQEVSSFPSGDHKAQLKRLAQMYNKHKTETITNFLRKNRCLPPFDVKNISHYIQFQTETLNTISNVNSIYFMQAISSYLVKMSVSSKSNNSKSIKGSFHSCTLHVISC